jgi:hypothetical protein
VIGRSARGTERSYPDQREPTAAPDARVLTRFQVISRVTGARDGLDALTRSTLRSDQWAAVPLVETLLPFDTRHELLRFLQLLALAGGSTLLIACVNVAAPMTSSAHRRRSRWRSRLHWERRPLESGSCSHATRWSLLRRLA